MAKYNFKVNYRKTIRTLKETIHSAPVDRPGLLVKNDTGDDGVRKSGSGMINKNGGPEGPPFL